ncbi:MAG: DNA repair protein RadA [Patescibacteria group bacterium]
MTKLTTVYFCAKCQAQTSKWSGRCLECGAWGTLKEEQAFSQGDQKEKQDVPPGKPVSFSLDSTPPAVINSTKLPILDEVLGGGLVAGSVTLLAGEPGIGKSTLLAQVALALASSDGRVIYVTGEESPAQIRRRLERLVKIIPAGVEFLDQSDAAIVAKTIEIEKPTLFIIDSIQSLRTPGVSGEAGSVNQVKASAATVAQAAKSSGVPVLLIGQVTKDGDIAGPRVLEHLVDSVLFLEGDNQERYRILRVLKHRFGTTDEVSLMSMTEHGLETVLDPSSELLCDRPRGVPGSAVTCLMEGRRPMMLEIQALVSPAGYGTPARRATGVDSGRLGMLIAVLARRASISAVDKDVYANAAGGLNARDPSVDLGLATAIASAVKDSGLDPRLCLFGEVGLSGELRPVPLPELRMKEIKRLGFSQVVLPKKQGKNAPSGLEVREASTLREALQMAKII